MLVDRYVLSLQFLLVGMKNREQAFNIAKAQTLDNMKPNPNYGLVEVIVTPVP
ncbi:Uncharacterised protein [Klebsiella pneumoniae]|uniref:Uncharacterized protein n=1 Tax=Klebsiella pneumoniae TaxID=573 RepID=A0A2X3IG38_KLEPN|nr:Uncharacterised protein [Klebsiella pneumoniae]